MKWASSAPRRALVQVLLLVCLLTAVIVVGTLGFHWIEGESLFDSFYMALITLTTVGYQETITLSQEGRYFNAFLILAGFSVVFVVLGILTQTLPRLELPDYLARRRTGRMIHKLSKHYIVCGLGRVGRGVIRQLQRDGGKVVAIDKDPRFAHWARSHDVMLITADATTDETLERAGADRAKGLVAALSSDAENMYVTLSAHDLNPDLRIVARAAEDTARGKLLRAGAQVVFSPYVFTGFRLAQALLRPQVSSFLDVAAAYDGSDVDIEIEEYRVETDAPYANATVADTQLTKKLDVILLAIAKEDGSLDFNPDESAVLKPGDALIVMGRHLTLSTLRDALGH